MKVLLDTCVWGGAKKTLVNLSAKQQGIVCVRVIKDYGQILQSGAIITVEPGRIRIRPPDENT
jgi:predicted nuclease of predicted toxin-antitoxin system